MREGRTSDDTVNFTEPPGSLSHSCTGDFSKNDMRLKRKSVFYSPACPWIEWLASSLGITVSWIMLSDDVLAVTTPMTSTRWRVEPGWRRGSPTCRLRLGCVCVLEQPLWAPARTTDVTRVLPRPRFEVRGSRGVVDGYGCDGWTLYSLHPPSPYTFSQGFPRVRAGVRLSGRLQRKTGRVGFEPGRSPASRHQGQCRAGN